MDSNRPPRPAGPSRERSKRPGFGAWMSSRNKSHNNTGNNSATNTNSSNASQASIESDDVSDMSNFTLGSGSGPVPNRSVIWGGYKHQRESVTAIVTNTLTKAEERLDRQLHDSLPEDNGRSMDSSDNDTFMSDSNIDADLGDLQSALHEAEEVYKHTETKEEMKHDLEAILDESEGGGNVPPYSPSSNIVAPPPPEEDGFLPTLEESVEPSSDSAKSDSFLRLEESAISQSITEDDAEDDEEEENNAEPDLEAPSPLKDEDASADANQATLMMTGTEKPSSMDQNPTSVAEKEAVGSWGGLPTTYADETQPLLATSRQVGLGAASKDDNDSDNGKNDGMSRLLRGLLLISGVVGCAILGWIVLEADEAIQTGFGLGVAFGLMASATALCATGRR